MKQRLLVCLFLFSCFACAKVSFATTWYVRADGGSRYTANAPQGQCDGKADAAYSGSGVNQHCAFGDYRYLWDDHSYGNTNRNNWAIAGGDTVILDNTKQWRVGFEQSGPDDVWCWGGNGPYGCGNPTIPSGTPSQHTRILGRNYANCSTNNAADPSKLTQIFGGHGVVNALNLGGAQYVDVQCLEITRHSQCILYGYPASPGGCSKNFPVDDFDDSGVWTDVNSHDLLLQDLWIHGHPSRGVQGAIGGMVTANRVLISTNGMAGWDFDDGSGGASASVNGNFIAHYLNIEFSGCNQEYPAVDPIPVASCYSQSTGGYGDGIGTPSGMGMNVSIDHSTFRYNTQDGEDFGHIDTGVSTLSITNSLSFANNGGQFKWGPGFHQVVFNNNLAVGNCLRMSQPLQGAPAGYNTNLQDFCRAEDALSFNANNNANLLFAGNTIVTYAPTTFDVQCDDPNGCANVTMTLSDNVVRGYDNPTTYNLGGKPGGPGGYCGEGCNSSAFPFGTINRYNNSYFGLRGCPAGQPVNSIRGTVSGETCNDPLFSNEPASFTNEAVLDNFNFDLSGGSPDRDSGIEVDGLTTDYYNNARRNPPSMGAVQFGGAAVQAPVQKGASSTAMSLTPQSGSQNSTLNVTVAAQSGGRPTGSVSFSVNGNVVGTVSLPGNDDIVLTVPTWVDQYTLTATYSGDSNYTGSSVTLAAK